MNLGPTPYRLPTYKGGSYEGPVPSEDVGVQQTSGVTVPSDYDTAVSSSEEAEQLAAEDVVIDPYSVLGSSLPAPGGITEITTIVEGDETLVLEAESFSVPAASDIIDGGDY